MQQSREDRSLGELMKDFWRDMVSLVHQEVELAKLDLLSKVFLLAKNSIVLVLGGVVAFSGFLVLLAAAVLALSTIFPPALAAVIVGGSALLLGLILLAAGVALLNRIDLTPRRTLDFLSKDKEWPESELTT